MHGSTIVSTTNMQSHTQTHQRPARRMMPFAGLSSGERRCVAFTHTHTANAKMIQFEAERPIIGYRHQYPVIRRIVNGKTAWYRQPSLALVALGGSLSFGGVGKGGFMKHFPASVAELTCLAECEVSLEAPRA